MDEEYYADWEQFDLFDQTIEHEDEGVIRAYSMASYPEEGNILKFNIRIATPPLLKGSYHREFLGGFVLLMSLGLKMAMEFVFQDLMASLI